MGIKCGIVGLPNVGKSTLFNALTAANVAAENYAFCTIDPNNGAAPLADSRLVEISRVARAKKTIPAAAEFVDIAGLVAGASQNAGLGNRFLSHIRETDGIAHVVRCFNSGDVMHVGTTPADDIATINTELMLADLQTAENALIKNRRLAKSGDETARKTVALCEKLSKHLGDGNMASTFPLTDAEPTYIEPLCLLTSKPMLYVANVDEDGFTNNPMLETITAAVAPAPVVPVCAKMEADLAGLSDLEKEEFLRDYGQTQTGLARLARAAFDMLGLATYFTAGEKEARAWTIRQGIAAPQAAGVIHTDFMHNFIRAETCDWHDFVELGGESAVRAAGKMRIEGKDYIVQDGDVIHFRIGK